MRAITNPKIEFLTNYEIAEAHGKDNLEALTIQSVMTGEKRSLPVRPYQWYIAISGTLLSVVHCYQLLSRMYGH